MRTPPARATRAILALLVLASSAVLAPASAGAADSGRWLAPFSEDADGDGAGDFDARPPQTREESAALPPAVNAAVLPDGRVLFWSQLEGTESIDASISFQQPARRSRSRVLDLSSYVATGARPAPSAFSTPSPEDAGAGDMVGSEQRHLPDGRVIAIGGTRWSNEDADRGFPNGWGRTELYGLADARVFDPSSDTWTVAAPMNRARYYPSLVTLPDGDLLVAAGADRLVYDSALVPGPHPSQEVLPENVDEVEVYDPETGTWRLNEEPGGSAVLPPFAHLHLMPNGEVVYPGVGMLYPPGGADHRAADWEMTRWYDPATGTWRAGDRSPLGVRSNAFSVMLPLEPPYDEAAILIGGGTLGPWPGSYVATPASEVLRWLASGGTSRALTKPMTTGRWHSSAVVLPTGEVLAFSGADKDEVIDPGSGVPVRHAEQFDPATGSWRRLATAARGRTLHNTAVLLRDGSVLVGGHSPAPAHYGAHTQNAPGLSSNFKDPSFEIFQPPALFRGPRPVIEGVSARTLAARAAFTVDTADAGDATLRAVLVRLPSTTHAIDNDQRAVVLEQDAVDGDTIRLRVPAATVVPPGHYYLFLTKDNGSGPTPSVAEIVRVTAG